MSFQKKVFLLSLTLLLLSEFLPLTWRSSLYGRALAWQAQVSRGGRRILGGVLTGEARVSQLCRYRGDQAQVQHNVPACLKIGDELRSAHSSSPICSSLLWQLFGLPHTPRLCNCPCSKPGCTVVYCLACVGHCIASRQNHLDGAFCCVDSLYSMGGVHVAVKLLSERAASQFGHTFTSVMTWLLALLVTVGHASWTPLDKIQAHTPPSPAFQSHVETCQRETVWSSEHRVWMYLAMTTGGCTCLFVGILQIGPISSPRFCPISTSVEAVVSLWPYCRDTTGQSMWGACCSGNGLVNAYSTGGKTSDP